MKGCEVRARTRRPEYGLLKTAPLFIYLFIYLGWGVWPLTSNFLSSNV